MYHVVAIDWKTGQASTCADCELLSDALDIAQYDKNYKPQYTIVVTDQDGFVVHYTPDSQSIIYLAHST